MRADEAITRIYNLRTTVALRCRFFRIPQHPDKCPGDEAAKGRFQALSLVHSVLSDPERRRLYDESGEIDPEDHDDNTQDSEMWYDICCYL